MSAADVEFSKFLARKYGMRVFFDSCTPCNRSLDAFDGWELVTMPDGQVLDAIPVPTTHDTLSGAARIVEAYA